MSETLKPVVELLGMLGIGMIAMCMFGVFLGFLYSAMRFGATIFDTVMVRFEWYRNITERMSNERVFRVLVELVNRDGFATGTPLGDAIARLNFARAFGPNPTDDK